MSLGITQGVEKTRTRRMSTKEEVNNFKNEERKKTLDHHIDERFAEIFFLAKDEFDIANGSEEEAKLYDLVNNFKVKLKEKCKNHFM